MASVSSKRSDKQRFGETNGRAKLTWKTAGEMRRRYLALPRRIRVRRGALTELAAEYGVTRELVLLVAKGRHWGSHGR